VVFTEGLREASPSFIAVLAGAPCPCPGMRTSPEEVAVKTKLQRVHCTDAPAGGSSRGSRSYCIEH
jgi:hypothetical protein